MTTIKLLTKKGDVIPLADLEIHEHEDGTLDLFGHYEGGIKLLIGYGIKAEFQ